MNKIYENIITVGKQNGKPIEAINAELKNAGANFHLNPDGGVSGWTEQEMKEGFIPGEDDGPIEWEQKPCAASLEAGESWQTTLDMAFER